MAALSLWGALHPAGAREGCPTELGWGAQKVIPPLLWFALLHHCQGDLLGRRISIFCCPKMKAFQVAGTAFLHRPESALQAVPVHP